MGVLIFYNMFFKTSPVKPESMNWQKFYPLHSNKDVEFLDIGCGYGGLLGSLIVLIIEENR